MAFLARTCPNFECIYSTPTTKRFYSHNGTFLCAWNNNQVPRYRCRGCKKSFSASTFKKTYRQIKPYVNKPIYEMYASGTTQRRLAKLLRINRKTVASKILTIGSWARVKHEEALRTKKHTHIQFDEMETFEHTRLKPVTVALAVEAQTHQLVDFAVAPIAYKGRLASLALRKYGPRVDESERAICKVLRTVKRRSVVDLELITDFKPSYVKYVESEIPGSVHRQVSLEKVALAQRLFKKGRRNVNDPLFALNFVAAKIRHDLSRMARKVWVTTKKIECLEAHMDLFLAYHNQYQIFS